MVEMKSNIYLLFHFSIDYLNYFYDNFKLLRLNCFYLTETGTLSAVKILIENKTVLTYSIAKKPLKSFDRPVMRVYLSDSMLVTLIFY